MKILLERDLVPNLTCEFKASGETNAAVQVQFAEHFDRLHYVQRSKMSQDAILSIDERAHELLSKQG